jgi:hypothetical protein
MDQSRRPAARRRLLIAAIGALVLALVAHRFWFAGRPNDLEVSVFFPSTNLSAWPNFVRAVHLAAEERRLAVKEDGWRRAVTVATSPVPIRFQWRPAIGSYEMQRIARDACRQARPPIAVVGANNTAMTEALGEQIRESSRSDWIPLLLMTTATADELIDLVPERTFRFGFSNFHQANAVVRRLQELYASGSWDARSSDAPVIAVVLQVLDNPFSVDLAGDFENVLKQRLDARIAPPPPPFSPGDGALRWSLKTAAGGRDQPTDEEARLAAAIADVFLSHPQSRPVLVLPIGGDLFRRILSALSQALERDPRTPAWGDPAKTLAVLSGDSLDYFDFAEGQRGRVPAAATPGVVVFFAHSNPLDPSLGPKPDMHYPSVGLNREVVRRLLDVLPSLGKGADPERLAEALAELSDNGRPLFQGRERRCGGGAIVAAPNRESGRFEFSPPADWASP